MGLLSSTRLISAGLAGAFCIVAAQAAALPEIQQRGYLVVGLSSETSAFHTVTEGKPTGFDADLLDALAKTAPFEIRRQVLSQAALAEGLQRGTLDLVASSSEVTPDRQRLADATAPLAETTLFYLKRHGDEAIHQSSDLGNRRFGILAGPTSLSRLTEFEHGLARTNTRLGQPVEFKTYAEAEAALAEGGVDFILGDLPILSAAAQREPARFELGQPVGHRIFAAWSLAKGNADLAGFVNGFLGTERQSGDLARLQQKWLGRAITDLPETATAQDWWAARSDRPAILPIPTRKDPD